MFKKYICKICGDSSIASICRSCAAINKGNKLSRDEVMSKRMEIKSKPKNCIKCGKLLSKANRSGLCKSCCRIGIHLSESTKKLISIGHKGIKHTQTTKDLLRAINTGKHPSEETRVKLSKASKGKKKNLSQESIMIKRLKTLNQIELGIGSFAINKYKDNKSTEKRYEEIINSLGYRINIDYIKQKRISNITCADFYFIEKNILVFTDGDYWHCNPEKFSEDYVVKQKNKTAKQIWENDRYITKECVKNGFSVLRYWETDLKDNDIINKIREDMNGKK